MKKTRQNDKTREGLEVEVDVNTLKKLFIDLHSFQLIKIFNAYRF